MIKVLPAVLKRALPMPSINLKTMHMTMNGQPDGKYIANLKKTINLVSLAYIIYLIIILELSRAHTPRAPSA